MFINFRAGVCYTPSTKSIFHGKENVEETIDKNTVNQIMLQRNQEEMETGEEVEVLYLIQRRGSTSNDLTRKK